MANRDIVAIGTSAGGFDALRFMVSQLPATLPATVLVAMHLSPKFPSNLDSILNQFGALPARFALDGEKAKPAHIYLAPPDHHLLYDGERLALGTGSRENYARPSIDPLFRSLAECCPHRAIGVLMTGTLGDGSSGLHILGALGGVTVVQDPEDAAFSEMPASALRKGVVDHITSLAALPSLLTELVRQPAGARREAPEHLKHEVEMARTGRSTISIMDSIARRSALTCPECAGVMWEITEGDDLRYRCHTGHAFTADLVNIALEDSLSRALAVALRSFEERVEIARSLERQATHRGHVSSAKMWRVRIAELAGQAEIVRDAINRIGRLALEKARPE